MRKKYLYVLICFLVSTLATANAANRTITGVVISGEDNELQERISYIFPLS